MGKSDSNAIGQVRIRTSSGQLLTERIAELERQATNAIARGLQPDGVFAGANSLLQTILENSRAQLEPTPTASDPPPDVSDKSKAKNHTRRAKPYVE